MTSLEPMTISRITRNNSYDLSLDTKQHTTARYSAQHRAANTVPNTHRSVRVHTGLGFTPSDNYRVRAPRTQRKYRYLGSILEVNLEISLIHDRLQVVITAYSTLICSNADMCLERDNRALMSVW